MAFGHGMPGDRLSQGYRLASLLARQNLNNGTNAGGAGHVLQQLILGLGMKSDKDALAKDRADESAAGQAMATGMSAKPWVNPDTGAPTIMDPSGKMVPTAQAGGYQGGIDALTALGDNRYAGRLAQSLMMAKMNRDEKVADIASQREYDTQRDDKNYTRSRQDALSDRADSRAWDLQMYGRRRTDQLADRDYMEGRAAVSPMSQEQLGQWGFPQGTVAFMDANGKPNVVVDPTKKALDPLAQAKLAKIHEENEAVKRQQGEALASIDRTIRTGQQLLNHPGREMATGKSHWASLMPGTNARDFSAALDAFKSQNFIPAVQQLKGTGQLSDAEGKKLLAAVGALDPAMSEEGFNASLAQIVGDLEAARKRMPGSGPAKASSDIDYLLKMYGSY